MRRQAAAQRECPIETYDIIVDAIRKNRLNDRDGYDYLSALLRDPEILEECKRTPFGRASLIDIAMIAGNARAVLALREGGFDAPDNLIFQGKVVSTTDFLNNQKNPELSSAVRKSIPRDNCCLRIRPLIAYNPAVQG